MCTPVRQLVISNDKVPEVGLRVHNAWMSGPGNTHPFVELVLVAVMTAGSLGMHKQETEVLTYLLKDAWDKQEL